MMKLLYNAHIRTLDETTPFASALLIDQGRLAALGDASDFQELSSSAVEREDMAGKTIWPGLIDSHLHLQNYALGLTKVNCETGSKEDCLARIAERVRGTPPGAWILGHGWNQNTWGSWPDCADLDALCPHNPVYLTAKSLHAAWVNSRALRTSGIKRDTPDPENGIIQRSVSGNATGILLESAMELVSRHVPFPSSRELEQAIDHGQRTLWRFGLTCVHDFDRREAFAALQELQRRNLLKLRVHKSLPVDNLDHAIALGLRSGFGNDVLWIGSIKVFMDGALGPRTAAMFDPFDGEPDNRGILNLDGEELFEISLRAASAGLGTSVHAIGDRANHEVLNAFEHLRLSESDLSIPHLRHRIEHVQIIRPQDAARLAALDIIASMQPIHATSDMAMADQYWGERSALAYAWRTQLSNGARLAFGSDAPVESPNPFAGLHGAVTRQRADGSPDALGWYPEQKLNLLEAVQAFTLGGAYAAYAEDRLGKLAVGYHADLIVLEKDPFVCHPSEIMNITPSATMIGGEWVWQSQE
jgi:hypothetical protein